MPTFSSLCGRARTLPHAPTSSSLLQGAQPAPCTQTAAPWLHPVCQVSLMGLMVSHIPIRMHTRDDHAEQLSNITRRLL